MAFQAPSTASFGVGSDTSAHSLDNSYPLRVVGQQALGDTLPRVSVPALQASRVIGELGQQMLAAKIDQSPGLGQQPLAWSPGEISTDQSWTIEIEGISTSPKNMNGNAESHSGAVIKDAQTGVQ